MLSKAAEMRGDCAFVLLGKAWQVKRGGKGKLVYLVSQDSGGTVTDQYRGR